MNNFDKVEVKLYKGNILKREIKFNKDTADIILEAIRFYWLNAERLENKLRDTRSQRLSYAAFNLKRDLQEVMDILYER